MSVEQREDARAIPTCVGTTCLPPGAGCASPGHPHVCGDYAKGAGSTLARTGPSPRVWGLRTRFSRRGRDGRAIPTCVGTTVKRALPLAGGTGHPHVCGDYGVNPNGLPPLAGPSPRVWGLRHPHGGEEGQVRAIPTCVGTTTRGTAVAPATFGPSPRVWGLRLLAPLPGFTGRAIPTCVGTTMSPAMRMAQKVGPSPRVWGLRPQGHHGRRGGRAIPTCVGTTLPGRCAIWLSAGHPHVCGDYVFA